MAGEWLKIELALPDKPEVHYIANALHLDPDAVVGKLFRVWAWFDQHTEDGNALGVTFSLLDRITSVTGFGEAMMLAGWMEQRDKVLHMPKFDVHTSQSSKKRALTAKRVAKIRNADVTLEALPREEKNKRRSKHLGGDPLTPPSSAASASPSDQLDFKEKGNGGENPYLPTKETWEAYALAYRKRHGVPPVRNAKVNSMVKQFVDRIGVDEAPGVAAFFVGSNRGLYMSSKHPVNLLLRDAESLRTEWATNRHGTETEARQADKTATIGNVFTKLIEESRDAKKNGA